VSSKTAAATIATGIVALSGLAQLEHSAYRRAIRVARGDLDQGDAPAQANVLATAVTFITRQPREYCLARLASIARVMAPSVGGAELAQRVADEVEAIRVAVPDLYERVGRDGLAALFSFGLGLCETLSDDVPDPSAARAELCAWANSVRASLRRQIAELGGTYDDLLEPSSPLSDSIVPWSDDAMTNALPLVLTALVFDLATGLAVSPGVLLAVLELVVVELRMSDQAAVVDAAIVDVERLEEAIIEGYRRRSGINPETDPLLRRLLWERRPLWKTALRHGVENVRQVLDVELPSATYTGARVVLTKGWPQGRQALRLRARELRSWVAAEIERAQAVHGDSFKQHRSEQAPIEATADRAGSRELERLEARHEVTPLLAVLSKREREVVDLRLDDLPFEEIGGRLGIDPTTARVHHHNAVLKMRTAKGKSAT
jgi:DNA-binding CsgD family transcriptional regulator